MLDFGPKTPRTPRFRPKKEVTEICERVTKEPQEVAEAVRLLAGAFAEKGPARRKLKERSTLCEIFLR